MKYEDFSIQVGPATSDGIHLRASCELGGEDDDKLILPVSVDRLRHGFSSVVGAEAARHLSPLRTSAPPALNLEEIGHALFSGVFRNGIRALLERSLGSLSGRHRCGLRIRLKTDLRDAVQAEIQSLPWELLFNRDTGSFLGLSRMTPVVRYLEVPRPIRPRRLPERFRIVVMASQPKDVPPIDFETECRNLQDLERRIHVIEVEILPRADLDTLRSVLLDRGADVVHIMGHGDHDPASGLSTLYLEKCDRSADPVATREVVETLQDLEDLRLVVLNACDTGRFGDANPFAALAPALVRSGLPAVLAMQRPILDEAAVLFSASFYRRLSAGDPVDTAVTEGRLALARNKRTAATWPIPALFMRTADGELFRGPNADRGGDAVTEGRAIGTHRPQPTWRAHLEVGNWQSACQELQHDLALDPHTPMATTALAIALTRGSPLRRLQYGTAIEIHRLLAAGLSLPDDRALAAICLIALKLDYFRANSVREPNPGIDEVLEIAVSTPLTQDAGRVFQSLQTTEKTRDVLFQLETLARRRR